MASALFLCIGTSACSRTNSFAEAPDQRCEPAPDRKPRKSLPNPQRAAMIPSSDTPPVSGHAAGGGARCRNPMLDEHSQQFIGIKSPGYGRALQGL